MKVDITMKLLTTTLVIFTLLICTINAFAAEGIWTSFTVFDNPEINVRSIDIAPDGSVWAGSDGGGIACYNSETWDLFTIDNGLADNNAPYVKVGSDGVVWIGTDGGGISRFDGEIWTTFTTDEGLADNSISAIDVSPDGTVWAGTQGYGVSRYDGESWITLTTDDGLPSNNVSAIGINQEGIVWIGTNSAGICRFDGESWTTFDKDDGFTNTKVNTIVFIGSIPFVKTVEGIFSYNENEKLWTHREHYFSRYYDDSIDITSNFSLWICMRDKKVNYQFFPTFQTFTLNDESVNRIYTIKAVDDYIAWIGTDNGKVFQLKIIVDIPNNNIPDDLPYGNTPYLDPDKKHIAVITSIYMTQSHADVIAGRILEGYGYYGENRPPRVQVISMYVDQVRSDDLSRGLADKHGFTIYPTIRETLLMGGDDLAVDGVLLIVEAGDYPLNEKGQMLYPRYEFYKDVMDVFRETGKSVPVFTDKHLSYEWDKAKWMYDQSIELGFPLMAGSSLPVTFRRPPMEIEKGTPIEKAVLTLNNGGESYGIHALEALQCMVERREGGETGIKTVQYFSDEPVWQWLDENQWAEELLEEAMAGIPDRTQGSIREIRNPALYLLEYKSGLEAVVLLSNDLINRYFGFAAKVSGTETPVSTAFWLQPVYYNHFSGLAYHIEELIINGEPSYPVERTLLTTGALSAIMDSKYNNGNFGDTGLRIDTPHLNINYTAQKESVYNQGEVPPYDNIFVAEEKPVEFEILQNYPNPFNPETTIEFSLTSESTVDLSIYNITGQKVRTIVSESMIAGIHSIRWDGTSESGQTLSSGVYIARITMGEKVAARSMMLMK